MTSIKDFRKNATIDGLCSEYSARWDSCGSKKQLIDMALGAKGMDYLCDSIAKGWGIDPSEIVSGFSRYINGNYVFDNGDYTSKMYCLYDSEMASICADTTAMVFIDCNVKVSLPKNSFCEIYVTGSSSIELGGEGRAVVITYGDNVNINAVEWTDYKIIHKKEKDRY